MGLDRACLQSSLCFFFAKFAGVSSEQMFINKSSEGHRVKGAAGDVKDQVSGQGFRISWRCTDDAL